MTLSTTEPTARKLLTKELMNKVEKRVRQMLDLASAIWPDHTSRFNDAPEIRYDVKNRVGGLAISGGKDDWTIRLNLILCYENEAHFIETTVAHEVAHLVQRVVHGPVKQVLDKKSGQMATKKIRSHGPEWKAIMVKFGLPPAIYHTYDTTSIQTKKRPRSKRGAKLTLQQTMDMMKRLETGFRRLSPHAQRSFVVQCEEVVANQEAIA